AFNADVSRQQQQLSYIFVPSSSGLSVQHAPQAGRNTSSCHFSPLFIGAQRSTPSAAVALNVQDPISVPSSSGLSVQQSVTFMAIHSSKNFSPLFIGAQRSTADYKRIPCG